MIIWWKIVLLFAVISSNSLYLTKYLHQSVKGDLTKLWSINFTIFAVDFKGILLYVLDYHRNSFVMTVKMNIETKSLRLQFNKSVNYVTLFKLCGCKMCDYSIMRFYIERREKEIKVTCNNNTSMSLTKEGIKENDDNIYAIPESLVNVTDKMYIMMGNMGPYIGEGNITVLPHKEQMVGCVENFYYKKHQIKFIEEGKMMRASCTRKYFNSYCNSGVYLERTDECDCSSTALNGVYCNESMKIYIKGGNHSYEKMKEASNIYLKMTWKLLLDKKYCLMEIEGRSGVVTIWTNKSHLMVDATIISDINMDKINFINVNITNKYVIIKINNKVAKRIQQNLQDQKIHVGTCKTNEHVTFEGAYDFHFDSSELRPLENISMVNAESLAKNTTINNPSPLGNVLIIIIIGSSLIAVSMIVIVGTVIINQRNIKQVNARIDILTLAKSIATTNVEDESCNYNKVTYDGDYSYIDDFGQYTEQN